MRVLIKTKDAVSFFGNKSKLAKALGISRSAVTQWGDYVPSESAAKLALGNPKISYKISRNKKPLATANS